MDIKERIAEMAEENSWSLEYQLELVLEFIEDTDNSESFSDFLIYATE